MKKFKLSLFLFLFFYSLAPHVNAQALDTKTISFIDSLLITNYPSDGPGMSLLIAKDGIPLYKKAFGKADIELNVPLSTDNVFCIGSMTKQFTAVCILQLADENKLSLSDDIKKYLPDYNTHGKVITIENCLTHTSGIPSFTEKKNFDSIYAKNLTQSEMISFFMNDPLLFEPGSDFSYSNSGFYLLGLIIEKLSGMSYNEYVQKNIFDKTGMTHSYFESETDIIPMRASGYDGQGDKIQNTTFYNRSWAVGAGNIMSTTGDLLLWNEALNGNKICSQNLLKKAFSPFVMTNGRLTNYGYGWNVTPLGKYTIIKHGGAINGYLADGLRVPEEKLYITALSNWTGKSPDNVTNKILMKLLNINSESQAPLTIDKNTLTRYVGAFEVNREGARLLKNFTDEKQYRYIFIEGDSLMLQKSGGSKVTLIPYGKDKFYVSASGKRFDFISDNNGTITALKVHDFPVTFGPEDICQKTDVTMPVAKNEITVSPDIMKKYVGEFQLQPGFNLNIFIENDKLFVLPTGQEKIQLYPESETKFFIKEVDAQAEFITDADGSVNKLIFTQGQKYECKRIK